MTKNKITFVLTITASNGSKMYRSLFLLRKHNTLNMMTLYLLTWRYC